MKKQIELSIIIPAYNEEHRLPLTLLDIYKHIKREGIEYEIIVVDNNSKDNTFNIAKKLMDKIKGLNVIECKTQGKGAAVKMGMLYAKGKIRIFTDADNSTSITHFFAMKKYFDKGSNVVIGSRAIKGAKLDPPQPWYRQIPGKLGNLFIQLVILPGIKDTQCGFKAFSEKATESIFSHSNISGWGFDVEVLALAKKMGYKIEEIPVYWVNDPNSHVGASAYMNVLMEVVKIRWRMITGFYKIK